MSGQRETGLKEHETLIMVMKIVMKLSQFASWLGAMINSHLLELPMSQIYFNGLKKCSRHWGYTVYSIFINEAVLKRFLLQILSIGNSVLISQHKNWNITCVTVLSVQIFWHSDVFKFLNTSFMHMESPYYISIIKRGYFCIYYRVQCNILKIK